MDLVNGRRAVKNIFKARVNDERAIRRESVSEDAEEREGIHRGIVDGRFIDELEKTKGNRS